MKKIALSDIHEGLGAKMVEFAGYYMPVQYTGVNDEHHNVRNGVGVFDVSHMGEFLITGPQALDLIQKVTSNDASKLVPGKVQYSCMPNRTGGIVDDLLVYRMEHEMHGDHYILVVNASNLEKDLAWINEHNTFDAKVQDISDGMSLLAVQGPKAVETVQALTDFDVSSLKYYTAAYVEMGDAGTVLLSATGYTGSGGFEIYVPNGNAVKMWNAVMEAGKVHGIKPAGLAARDTLRLEMGFCLYGNDINEETSPLEAGLGWITKFTKEFVNSAALQAQKEAGVSKKLVAFEMIDRGIPRHDHAILDADGNSIGIVTSGTMSPSTQKAIGMGYVPKEMAAPDTEIAIEIRNKAVAAKVVSLPFYKV